LRLLDTNIVVYALGGPHRYREPCRRLFEDIARGNVDYLIDVELLQEVLYVYSARALRQTAYEVFDRLLQVFPDPLPIGREDLLVARDLLERWPRLSPRDSIHAAVVLNSGLDAIVTADKDLGEVEGVTSLDPLELYGQA
jgi:predicted nucleic acid-binding protein